MEFDLDKHADHDASHKGQLPHADAPGEEKEDARHGRHKEDPAAEYDPTRSPPMSQQEYTKARTHIQHSIMMHNYPTEQQGGFMNFVT